MKYVQIRSNVSVDNFEQVSLLGRNALQHFVKYEHIKKCKTASAYKQIDLLDKPNILSKSKLNIGRATDITVYELKQKDHSNKNVCYSYLQPLENYLAKQS